MQCNEYKKGFTENMSELVYFFFRINVTYCICLWNAHIINVHIGLVRFES